MAMVFDKPSVTSRNFAPLSFVPEVVVIVAFLGKKPATYWKVLSPGSV